MKKILPILLSLSLIFLVTAQVSAKSEGVEPVRTERLETAENRFEEQQEGRDEERGERQEERQERRQEWLDQRCEVLENKISVQVNRYENNAEKHIVRYERMVARLNALVTRLQADGIDTTELAAAVKTLDEKVQLFAHNATSYVEELKATQEFACGESAGDFKNSLTASRSLLQILRENVLDIRSYWQEILRPLITGLVLSETEE